MFQSDYECVWRTHTHICDLIYFPCVFKNACEHVAPLSVRSPVCLFVAFLVLVVCMCAHAQEPSLISHKTNIHWTPFGNYPVVKSGCPAVTSLWGHGHILATAHPVCGDNIWHYVGGLGGGSMVCK